MAHDVFISYAKEDKITADAVCHFLERAGVRCWLAPRDAAPGAQYGASIITGINSCQLMVLILSSHANASDWVTREVERAASKAKFILPVRVEDVQPSGAMELYIAGKHWLDAIDPPMENHLDELCDRVREALTVTDAASATATPRSKVKRPRNSRAAAAPARARPSIALWVGAGLALCAIAAWLTFGRSGGSADASGAAHGRSVQDSAAPARPAAAGDGPAALAAPTSDPRLSSEFRHSIAAEAARVDEFGLGTPLSDRSRALQDDWEALAREQWTAATSAAVASQLVAIQGRLRDLTRDADAAIAAQVKQLKHELEDLKGRLQQLRNNGFDASDLDPTSQSLDEHLSRLVARPTARDMVAARAAGKDVSSKLSSWQVIVDAKGAAAVSPAVPATASTPTPKLATAVELAQLAADAAFRLTVKYPTASDYAVRGVAQRVQTGFLVGENGVAITSYSALQKADRAEATFGSSPVPCPVEFLDADPAADLALVKVGLRNVGQSGASASARYFPLSSRTDGAAAWIVCDAGSTTPAARPIGDVGVDTRLTGSPVLDQEGTLCGVWAWPRGSGGVQPGCMSAASMRGLIARSGGTKPRSIKTARESFSGKAAGLTLPRLAWPKEPASIGEVTTAALRLVDRWRCPECKGAGYKIESELRTKTFKTQKAEETRSKVTCGDCDGSKLWKEKKKAWTDTCSLAAKACRCAPKDQDLTLSELEKSVAAVAALNEAEFLSRVNGSAREELKLDSLIPGTAVAFVIPASQWPTTDVPDWPDPARMLTATPFPPMLLISPVARSAPPNASVFVVGVVAGAVAIENHDWIVLEHAIAVPIAANTKERAR